MMLSEIISEDVTLNLVEPDIYSVLREIKRVLAADGNSVLTTLVKGNRWSNRYLNMLAGSGALISRSSDELLSMFNDIEMRVTHNVKGNLAFFKYGEI